MGKHLQGVQEEEDNEKRGRTLERRKEREREQCAARCGVRKKTSGAAKRGGRRVGEIVRGEGKEGANVIERHSGRESETAKGERKL